MKAVTIRPRAFIPAGAVYVMPNMEHPEADPSATVDEAEHLLIACHPDDEQRLRDVIAVEQERPGWWRDMQGIERALRAIGAAPSPMD